jgi:two-component system NtrC family sensor kinase
MFKFPSSIRQKIVLGYYAGVTVIILISLFTFTELWYMEKQVQFGEVVSEFFDTVLDIRRFEKNSFLYNNKQDYQETIDYVKKAQAIIEQNVNKYSRLAAAPELESIKEDLRKYSLLMNQFAVTKTQDLDRRSALEKEIRKQGQKIVTIADNLSTAERKRLQTFLIRTQQILVSLIVFFSLTGIAIGQVLSRMVVKPLHALEDQMSLIAEGRLKTVSINSKDREILSLTNVFNKMLQELELRQKHLVQREKLASMGTLVSGVAHELNNPLSNISSSCQILTEELEDIDVEYKKELLSQISTQTDRARDIVRSLLEFSRQREFKKESYQLNKLVEETILFLKGSIPAGVETILEIPSDVMIFADKQRMQQVFLNLIKNAVESIEEEGKVFIRAQKHFGKEKTGHGCDLSKYSGICTGECPVGKDTIDIEIQDTGVGIPPEILPRIFDPFFTTKDSEKDSARFDIRKGSGLGLYVVEEIIEEHSGCIGVYSEVGKGTSFLIRLSMEKA